MTSTEHLLARAREYGQDHALPYAGSLTPVDTFALLADNPDIRLVDVRTNAERDWVGKVNIAEAQHLAVQWSLYPGSVPNSHFIQELSALASADTIVLFLCRSGVRSRHAAKLATESGYRHCFDILEGFEGDRDTDGHRKTVAGWCKAGLPWIGA
ncbi:rhodanese-like domain-containing protein [Actimicrobium sp. CCC2.4]|uniref:rhodanese-like domain-containing protein n=1 Tax=Actimicrobium sp. CCC2.4 TaxID=3048606 RepID=UPI002AC8C7DD|nr:rhodanese-like domain-containing protein [Actimicrobium sp. CCC2.4]MEB0136577.1 rhodanese-like domain-containing protein [Actimicrobium sp. CCC2.4]WPX31737.1 rhodanese-like domain-containing protein [Actimicrobium sp. CCC2.4]